MRTRLFGLGFLVMLAGAVLTLGVLWAAPAALADGKAGDLDTSLGNGGRVTTDFSSGSDTANAVAIRDNRIVAAGRASTGGGDFAVAIYNLDGSLRFDRVVTDFGDSETVADIAITPGQGIIAAGRSGGAAGFDGDIAVARYFGFGTLNPSFGDGGKITTGVRDRSSASAVAIQPDDKIVVAGTSCADGFLDPCDGFGDPDDDFALVRYNPDGSLDSSFDGDGKVITGFGDDDFAEAVAIQSDGKIVAAGHTSTGGGRFFLARYHAEPFDDTPPKVKKVVPTENATGIAPGTNVSAFFSEAMKAGSINTKTVKLFKTGTTTPIAAVVSYNAEKKKATLNPDTNLQRGAKYKAVVSKGARDLAGNQLDQNPNVPGNQRKQWFFTVRN